VTLLKYWKQARACERQYESSRWTGQPFCVVQNENRRQSGGIGLECIGMIEVLRTESDTEHRYRILRTDRGVLLTTQQKTELGLMLGPTEWLYQTTEAAEKGLEFVMLMNAWWLTMTCGYPPGNLPNRCENAAAVHKEVIERLNDEPLMGEEVRELRR